MKELKEYKLVYMRTFLITLEAASLENAYDYLTNMGGKARVISIELVDVEGLSPEFLEDAERI